MERNKKGQFVKGVIPKGARPISKGVAKEMQARSVASRLANKRGAELLRAMLEKAVTDPAVLEAMRKAGYKVDEVTNEVALHARQIEKAQRTGDTRAYSALMKAAGYDVLNVKTDGPKVVVVSQEAVKAASKWSSKKK